MTYSDPAKPGDRMKNSYDCVIVGAGMAGLSAAWTLKDHDILVLESSSRVGGRVYSERHGNAWLNYGAHLFGGPQSLAGQWAQELDLPLVDIKGSRRGICVGKKVIADSPPELLPFLLPLPLPARYSLIRMGLRLKQGVNEYQQALKSFAGMDRLSSRAALLSFREDHTLKSFIGPLHPDVDAILHAVTERIASSPGVMSAGCGISSFSQVWSKGALARNLSGGSSLLPIRVSEKLGRKILTDSEVLEVAQSEDAASVTFRTDEGNLTTIHAKSVIVAAPAPVAARILKDPPTETADALTRITYGPFLSVAVATRERVSMPWDNIYAMATPGKSFSVFFNMANTLRDRRDRVSDGSLMLFRGGDGARELISKSNEEITERFIEDLTSIFPTARPAISDVRVQRWPLGAPYITPTRAQLQTALTTPIGRIALAGDYLEFASMEAAIATGQDAAVLAKKWISA